MKSNRLFYVIFICLIILVGCWDVVNIEDRGFIIGSAIDLADTAKDRPEILMMTNQVVVPAGMVSLTTDSGGGEQAFLNFTTTGKSIFEMEEEVATLSSKMPYYEHLSVLVISEDVLKVEGLFSRILDTYIRDENLRRGIQIVATEGKAKNILEYTSPDYKLPARYIEKLMEKGSRQVGLVKPVLAGDVEEFHLKNNSYVLPYVTAKNYLQYKAGAVFHGPKKQMVGLLDEKEMQAVSMITNEKSSKVIEFNYNEEPIALEIVRFKSKMNVDPKTSEHIQVTLDVEIEGVVKELIDQEDLTEPSGINSIQQAVSDHVKKSLKSVLEKGQDEYGTDIFGVWKQMETRHYSKWKQLKTEWEEGAYYFKDVIFNVGVQTEIYSIGTSKETD